MAIYSIDPNELVTFRIWHEDDDVVVVGKPAHIVTTPGKGHDRNSLQNGLFAKWGPQLQKVGRARDFGLLHRLDKLTSGLVICALHGKAYDAMRAQFEAREVAKYYWAVTTRAPRRAKGVLRKPIAEYEGRIEGDPRVKKLAKITSTGKPALTAYRVLEEGKAGSLLECRAVTGRLHQVRVHMASIGCPVLGEDCYADRGVREQASRYALHAHRVVFMHPITRQRVDVRSAWPDDLKPLLKRMGIARPDLLPQPDGDE